MFKRTIFIRVITILSLLAMDLFFIGKYVEANHELPFQINRQLVHELIPSIPLPTPVPDPVYYAVTITEADWQGRTFIGKVTNENTYPIFNTEVRISVSPTKEPWEEIKAHTFTIPSKIEAGKHIFFSKTLPLETNDYWWSIEVKSSLEYKGDEIPSPAKDLKISETKPKATTTSNKQVIPIDTGPWGVAKQLDEVTWTIKVKEDDRMATAEETLIALNAYRKNHGSGELANDDNLAAFARDRAKHLNSIQSTDKHAGFKTYVENEENVKKLGFGALGENSGYGHKLIGVHLIEWIYAGDPLHDANQLDKQWSHVGIGIEGLAVVFIFGGAKF